MLLYNLSNFRIVNDQLQKSTSFAAWLGKNNAMCFFNALFYFTFHAYTKVATCSSGRDVAPWLERSLMVRWVVGSILHGVDPLSYFSLQPVLHDWCNKGRGLCYPVCGMVHIKEPLLLIGKSSPCGGSGFPLSLSEWSFTICPTPYNRKIKCVECIVK